MAKKPKPPKAPEAEPSSLPTLAEALKFIKPSQLDTGKPEHRHCVMYGGWVLGFNGILSMGHRIEEDLTLAPLTVKLLQALERCEGARAMTALPSGLSVKSGRFRAVVPCMPMADIPNIWADPPVVAIDDRLRAGFDAIGPIATEGALRAVYAAVRLAAGSMVATNGKVIAEYWHGLDLPPVLLPKQALAVISGVKKPLATFGFSDTSATFYFDDGSWVKTQLYVEQYPKFEHLMSPPGNEAEPPEGFFDALRMVKPFTNDIKAVLFDADVLNAAGGSVDVPGLPAGQAFNVDLLLLIEKIAKRIDFGEPGKNAKFFGDNIRGIIAPMKRND